MGAQEIIANLNEGDEIEVTYRGVFTASPLGSPGFLIGESTHFADDNILSVRLIKKVDPGCPFPMGAKVKINYPWSDQHDTVGTITDWFWSEFDQKWFVQLNNDIGFNGKPQGWEPTRLILVSETALDEPARDLPVWWKGEWWAITLGGKYYFPIKRPTETNTGYLWVDMHGAIPANLPKGTE